MTSASDPWDLDRPAVRAAFDRASDGFAAAAVVHREARQRLIDQEPVSGASRR